VVELIRLAEGLGGVRVVGLMGYEAQIAGLQDANPFDKTLNSVKSMIRRLSIPDVAARRRQIADTLKKKGIEIELFNGGGTGSLKTTAQEDPITEVTAGSGFLCPALFSYYKDYDFVPAAFFALQVVRRPAKNVVTCLGGGYIASGPAHEDKLPMPYLPEGLTLLLMEGAGEVQTPVVMSGKTPDLKIGDPIIFRHSKAGEIAEHFNTMYLVRDGKIIDEQKTYRGLGMKFL
jgi:D-serine deaminase-like pyridoxal phosphate-dependent protein